MELKDKRTGCVYKIQTPGGPYVGATITGFAYRWSSHVGRLRNSNHFNKDLQAQWDKNGPTKFSFEVLEVGINPEHLNSRESYWIKELDAHNTGMNASSKSGMLVHKEEQISAIIEDIKSSVTYREISDRHGVSLGTVSNINKKYILGT